MTMRVRRFVVLLVCLTAIVLGGVPGRTQEAADKDQRADLCRITLGKGSGVVDAFVASAASGFKEFSLTMGTGFKSDGDEHAFFLANVNPDGRPELCRVTPAGKGEKTVTIFIATADSYFNDVAFTLSTPFPADVKGSAKHCYTMGDVDGDKQDDLCRISPAGEDKGDKKVALFVAPGKLVYQGYSLTIGTCYAADEKDYVWRMADVDGDGKADLCRIQPPKQGTGRVELFVATGKSLYSEFLYTIGTELVGSATDDYGMADVTGDGKADLYAVKKMGTKSGKAELSVATADLAFSQLSAILLPTPFPAESGHVYLMGRVKSLKERKEAEKQTPQFGDTLAWGTSASALGPDQTIRSANSQYELTLHGSGNLVLVHREPGKSGIPIWSNNVHAPGGGLYVQADGNVVQYLPGGRVVWATHTAGKRHSRLVVRDDGNLVVVGPDGYVHWSSRSGRPDPNAPVEAHAEFENMRFTVRVNRSGLVQAHRHAEIKKQSDSWRHFFWFTIADEKDNDYWPSPSETLTIGSALDVWGRPSNVGKDGHATYQITPEQAKKAFRITIRMEREKAGGGSLIDRLEQLAAEFKRVDAVYKTVKESELFKDAVTLMMVAK